MNHLQNQQMWDTAQLHHANLLQEAKNVHMAKQVAKQEPSWWKNLFRRHKQAPTVILNPSAVPELR